jgi:thiamine biosynthesis lipoprotein
MSTRLSSVTESFVMMGTVVSIRVVTHAPDSDIPHRIDRAMAAMRAVQDACNRFDAESALCTLCRHPGQWMDVPPSLYYALRVARAVAELTDGVFDPTVGPKLERLGFTRNHLTGEDVASAGASDPDASYRDITLADDGLRVRLERPLLLDLGAVAKGLAVDVAAKALEGLAGFAIDAGGDVYVSGVDPDGATWQVGIEDPRRPDTLLTGVAVSSGAVCTSGSYRRRSPVDATAHHLVNAITGRPADGLLSATVIGPSAMLADATATAAFLLGPEAGPRFIADLGLAGLFVTTRHEVLKTPAMEELPR